MFFITDATNAIIFKRPANAALSPPPTAPPANSPPPTAPPATTLAPTTTPMVTSPPPSTSPPQTTPCDRHHCAAADRTGMPIAAFVAPTPIAAVNSTLRQQCYIQYNSPYCNNPPDTVAYENWQCGAMCATQGLRLHSHTVALPTLVWCAITAGMPTLAGCAIASSQVCRTWLLLTIASHFRRYTALVALHGDVALQNNGNLMNISGLEVMPPTPSDPEYCLRSYLSWLCECLSGHQRRQACHCGPGRFMVFTVRGAGADDSQQPVHPEQLRRVLS